MNFSEEILDKFIQTPSERFYINVSDQVVSRKEIGWTDLFKIIDHCEEMWRKWLAEGLTTPYSILSSDVMSGIQRNNSFREDTTPTFKVFSEYGKQTKFKHLKRNFIFFDWMQSEGYFDANKVDPCKTTRQTARTRFPKNFEATEIILDLKEDQYKAAWEFILLDPETRVSLMDTSLEDSLRFDFDYIRSCAQKSFNSKKPIELLNDLFNEALTIDNSNSAGRTRKCSLLRFLTLCSCNDEIFLPSHRLAANAESVKGAYSGFMKSFACRYISGPRLNEISHAMLYLKTAYKGQRQLRLADFFLWFCAGNYGSSSEFSPDFLKLVQTATTGEKNNIAPYFSAIRDFFQVDQKEFRDWEHKMRTRHSVAHIEGPMDFFTKHATLVKKSMKVQVENFEAKTGSEFPSEFDIEIKNWATNLDSLIRRLPRKTNSQAYDSSRLWIMYLSTLDTSVRPRDFTEVKRSKHILGETGYIGFLNRNHLDPRTRLQDLLQLMKVWASDQETDYNFPLKPGIDWKNRKKDYRTKRKAMPELIVQTLIEENSRPCADGIPYQRYREWVKNRGRGGNIQNINGIQIDAVIPSTPAIIDCILHLGMRSSSARFLDSGQADEFLVEIESLQETRNPSHDATKGIRNGFLQRVQVGVSEYVPSFLMLRNKTTDAHEIPYAPVELVKRLQVINQLQQKHNPIADPTRATDDDRTMNNLDLVPLIFPLFRDPTNPSSKPISYSKVSNWWNQLLRDCEPIVNEKRASILGSSCEQISFFDLSGNPVWDIHSIRVTVVTALLEMGVPPTIIQHLVGHKSPLMTLHYQAIENKKISLSIKEALEQRRLSAAEAIANAVSEDDLERAIEEVLGGISLAASGQDYRAATNSAFSSARTLRNAPGTFSVFSHGICPGADCAQGGVKKGDIHLGVHRDKACSRCRFRITGPAFLGGLELNANILMFEISESLQKEEKLNKELLERSKSSSPCGVVESRISRELEYRDELWADWAAEYKTILECMTMLQGTSQNNLPALPEEVQMTLSEKHRLPMVQALLDSSEFIAGSGLDLPDGMIEVRDAMIYDIALQEGQFANYLISLPSEAKSIAIKKFSQLVCQASEELDMDPSEVITKHPEILKLEELLADQ